MTKNRPIQIMIGFAVISVIALIAVQVYWVSLAVDEQEQSFDHNVRMSLRAVADNMCMIDGNDLIAEKPIDRVAGNYFVARLQYNIDVNTLERLISNQFEQRSILLDYEYGVYNCESDQMVFGNQVSLTGGKNSAPNLPKLKEDEYYFGVYFPNKRGGILAEMNQWKYMTGGSILMLAFFSYGLTVVLKQKRLSEVQHQFIDNVTHELKTPIATLKLAAEALNETETDSPYAKIISEETNRLQNQVEQILQASMVEKLDTDVEEVDLNDFLRRLVSNFQRAHADLDWTLDFEELPTLSVSTTSLEIAINNLIDNAIKYGNGKIAVKAGINQQAKVEISISDNGPGIPQKYSKQIFDKFFRIPTGDLHDVKGHGLGMFLVKEHLKKIGATIVVSRLNELTTMKITIPRK